MVALQVVANKTCNSRRSQKFDLMVDKAVDASWPHTIRNDRFAISKGIYIHTYDLAQHITELNVDRNYIYVLL